MFHLTPNAAEQILRAAAAQPDSAAAKPCLRVAAKIEDNELVYGMGFDEERENDAVIEVAGINILIAPRSHELLTGTTLDFVELKPGEFQFIFLNPNETASNNVSNGCVSRSSGCGSCGSNNSGGCN
jgi:iron-sulfur cluster assembly protein